MDAIIATGIAVSDRTRAIALGFSSWVSLWQDRGGVEPGSFEESVRLFRAVGASRSEALALCSLALAYISQSPPDLDGAERSARAALAIVEGRVPTVESMAKVTIGRVLFVRGDMTAAVAFLDDALAQAEDAGDLFACTIALTNRGWVGFAMGEHPTEFFERNLRITDRLGHVDGSAYGFEGLIAGAVVDDDAERAGVLTGAAEAVRQLTGVGEQPSFLTWQPYVESVLHTDAAPIFEAGRARGRAMTLREATDYALAGAPTRGSAE
jgi:hypothetical protein